MKVRISYQHSAGHSKYDREWVGEADDMSSARAKAQRQANLAIWGIGLPTGFGWKNRVHQGDNMVVVMYDV